MADPKRSPGFFIQPQPAVGPGSRVSRTEFYREEFIKHCECLRRQREYYSEVAITNVEAALARLMARLEQLSAQENAEELVSRLLRKLDAVTGLSYWTDPTTLH